MNIDPKSGSEFENNAEVNANNDAVLENNFNNSDASDTESPFQAENSNVPTASSFGTTSETPYEETGFNNSPVLPKNPTGNAVTATRGSSTLPKALAVIAVLLLVGVGLVVWKNKFAAQPDAPLTNVTAEDMQLLLKDANPMQLKAIASNPEQKKKIAESLQQLLAVASQARKEGIADDPNIKNELQSIRSLVTASLYDKKINADKPQMPPFSFITEDQINEFYNGSGAATHEAEFKKFLDSKVALAREAGKFPKDKELDDEEIKQAKDDFARVKIYEEEATAKKAELGEDFNRELNLQVKLQQAQFLATQYAQKFLVDKTKVTDEDVKNYIASHPEYDTKEKKAKAEEILSRAKSGEDFTKLAKEYSEDPGSKDKGGLYENVPKGQMVPAFEQAALALEPGQIAENLVETPFGYHIIKLEKKNETKDAKGQPTETYNVRHILIGTTIKDPNNPMAQPMPIEEKVKSQLEEEKQKQVLDEIVANNPVQVASDFTVPEPTDEQIQQMQQQQMQQMKQMQGMSPGGGAPGAGGSGAADEDETDAPKSTMPVKPQPKKK